MEGFKLISYFNTSSPCSHCWFLKELHCTFPKNQIKECSINTPIKCGRGWDTKEYIKIVESKLV